MIEFKTGLKEYIESGQSKTKKDQQQDSSWKKKWNNKLVTDG